MRSRVYSPALLVPCGKCVGCRTMKSNAWRIRLKHETEYTKHKNAYFVTLTIDPEHLVDISSDPSKYIRRFLERYRKQFGKSLRHWFISELGHENGRLHFHGIIYDFAPGVLGRSEYKCYKSVNKILRGLWQYGSTWVGYCNVKTTSYIVKYMTDPQKLPSGEYYKPIILTSPGIGKCYTDQPWVRSWHHQTEDGLWYILSSTGHKMALPRYYKLKLFSDYEIYLHTLDTILNPPPLLYKGRTFDSQDAYYSHLRTVYEDSLKRKTSIVNLTAINYHMIGEMKYISNPNTFYNIYDSKGYYPRMVYPNLFN